MNFITRRHLSRRSLLQGAGAAIALPFLDAMHPAMSAERDTAAATVKRLLIVEYPHGVVDETWCPVGEGSGYQMSESLAPLSKHRQKLLVLRGLTSAPDRKKADFHDRAIASYLTGCELTAGEVNVGVSVDQVAAKELGKEVPLASLELCTETTAGFGSMCFRDAHTNLPMERNPRLVFERLFGDDDRIDPASRAARTADEGSILDSVRARIAELNGKLGVPDRRKLDQYLDSIRDIERRIQIASSKPQVDLPAFVRPAGIPDNWPDHVRLMFDLQVLALQADLTRVVSFATAAEGSQMTFPHLGISMTFHEVSHHNNGRAKLDALSRINKTHSELLAYYLDKLDSVHESNGTLLDNSVLFYGSTLSNPSIHSQRNLPVIIAGGAAAGIKAGRYVRLPGEETPLSNLHLTLLDKLGIHLDRLGDSTGKLVCLDA